MAQGITQSLGSVLIHGYQAAGVFYEPYLTETYDVATNTSTLSIAHRIRIMEEWGGSYDIPNNTPIYVTIDGTQYSYTPGNMPNVRPNNVPVTAATTTHTVTHNSDGSKSITIQCQWNNSSASYYGKTSSQTVTLTTIPRASTMTFNTSQTMGTAYTFTITRAASSFTHTITWSFGGSSGTAVSSTSSTTPSFTPATATFAPKCTNATSGTITYTLNTYSGSSLVGSKSYTATLAVPSSVVPTVSLAVSAVNAFNSLYLQGKSSVKLTATGSVSSDYGATIKSYTFTVTNASATVISTTSTSTSATSATHTSGVLTSSGTHTCRVTITDSRGRTANATRTITVTAYSKPVWGQVSAYRSDSSGTSADEGTSIALTATASYSAVSGNSLSMTYQYKEATASSWSSAVSYTNGTLTVIGSAFDITKGYNIKVTATDTVGNTITTTAYVGTSAVGIDYDPTNNTLGLLRYAPTGSSDAVYMPKGYAFGPDGSTFSELITRAQVGSGSANDMLFTIPLTTYSDIGASADAWNATTAEKWLKYVTATYGAQLGTDRMVINELIAGVRHVIIGSAYNWADVVSGMPRYSWFTVRTFANELEYFSTNGGVFDYRKIGEVLSVTPSSVSVPNSSVTQIATLSVGGGTWWIRGVGNWGSSGSGYRMIMFEGTTSPTRGLANTTPGTSATATTHELTRVVNYSSSATVTLYAWQNSGSALSVWPKIEAVRIA